MTDLVAIFEDRKKEGSDYVSIEGSIRMPWTNYTARYEIESFGDEGPDAGVTHEWRKVNGVDASFSIAIYATVTSPQAFKGHRIGASFNEQSFRFNDLEKGFLGAGTFESNYFKIGIIVPPNVVKDTLEKLRFHSEEPDQVIRFDLIHVRPGQRPTQVIYKVVRIYI